MAAHIDNALLLPHILLVKIRAIYKKSTDSRASRIFYPNL